SAKVKEVAKKVMNKQAIFGGVLVLIMLSLLVMVGFLLFNKAFKPASIAKIIPGKNVIALLEINSNFQHSQIIKGTDLMKNHQEYSKENFVKYIETQFKVNYETELASWLGRSVGVVFLSSEKENGAMNKLYFAEMSEKESAKQLFSKGEVISYEGAEIYFVKENFYATFVGDYVFISAEKSAVKEFIDSQKDKGERLYSFQKYRKINDNLPINKIAFVYLDFEKINNGFIQNFPILSEKGLSIESLSPFFNIFKAEGFALIAMNNNFVIQSFLSLDAEKLESGQYIASREKYHARMMNFVSTDALAFWGGVNLEYQLKRTVEVFSGGNAESMAFINAIIQSYVQKHFGKDMDFRKDLLPLLTKEYALAVEEIDNKNVYKIILELGEKEMGDLKLEEIMEKFIKSGGLFTPTVVDRVLADGTTTREIMAVPEEVNKSETDYKGVKINGLKIGERNWGIYYSTIENIAVIATDIEGVKNAIDISSKEKQNLKSTAIFDYQIAPILENSDEITYFNIKKLAPLFVGENYLNEYLKPIMSFSSGKNYFNDGIVTINYLHID
ncbi:MAG: DUF3352 domain-containing protein, partial [Candidatus Gracilibacteria bacterium]|nr:DUF3352 domain-containing protein [Candidatus Gracilibacteria bacterium]